MVGVAGIEDLTAGMGVTQKGNMLCFLFAWFGGRRRDMRTWWGPYPCECGRVFCTSRRDSCARAGGAERERLSGVQLSYPDES